MDEFSNSFFRRFLFLGIFFLKKTSCQEYPIIHIDSAHISSILQDQQMLRDLSRALSEVQPVFLQTFPEREFYHLNHPRSAVHSFYANAPPEKKDATHSSTNNRLDFAKPAIAPLPDPRPHSSNLFPSRRELEPKFSNPQLAYGFVPRVGKSESDPPKREIGGFSLKSQTRNFPARRSHSEMPPLLNLKLQKTEKNDRGEQETKNKQISAFRDHPSHFRSRDQHYRTNWDDSRKVKHAGTDAFHAKPRHNAERGQESVRRQTTLIGDSQISFVYNRKEPGPHKQKYPELPSRQSKNANKKFSGNEGTTKRPLSFVNFALMANLRDTPVYKVNGANGSQLDEPVTSYRNPEVYSQHGEIEKKRYIVFKATSMVTTKRPASAPFTAAGFFRNVPQSSPRDVTVVPPEYSPQVSAVLPAKPSSTPAMKPAASGHTAENKAEKTTSSYSNEHKSDFQVTDLREGKTAVPYVGYLDEDLHYEEDPFGDTTEVYLHDGFELPLDRGLQTQANSSFRPISSPSSASYAVHQSNDGKSQRKKPGAKKSSSRKSFAKTKSESTEDTDADDNSGVPGQPGTDYPNYYDIPQTNFDCREFYVPGYYADVEAGCQVFHNCDTDLQKHSFLCPNGTVFRQELFICDWWYNVRCEDSPDHFPLYDGLYTQP